MKPIQTCLLSLACALVTAALASAAPAVAKPAKPNIIFLLADDQSTYSVGCYGNKDVVTPEMDQLGRDGVIFDRHYDTTAICMASRASIYTGMYEYKTGTNFSHGNMRPETWAKSYPKLMREAGYLTAFAGKFGMVVDGQGLCEGDFDYWGGDKGQTNYETALNPSMGKYVMGHPHSTLAYAAFSQDVIRDAVKQQKPFCLSISFKAPHRPWTPDPKFDAVYAGKTFTKPANFGRENGTHLSPQSRTGREYTGFTEWHYDTDYDGVTAKYYQLVHGIDVAVGMIRAELDRQGIADNTVIIYTSDNGYMAGSHGYGYKELPYEESSRAPLMIYDPRSPAVQRHLRSAALTGNIDFAPTMLDLAGLPVPTNMDGKSLVPLLKDATAAGHDQLSFTNVFGNVATSSLSCVTPQFKYTYWWYEDDMMTPVEELFDTVKDPLEMTNLAPIPEYTTVLKDMRQKYDQQLAAWKREAVDYNNYQPYGTLFDRTIPMKDKQSALKAARLKSGGGEN